MKENKKALRAANRAAALATNKLEFARRVTEQRLSNCISDSSLDTEMQEELVTLYSTLVDEENFVIDDNNIIKAKEEFLTEVEEKINEKVDKSGDLVVLENVKNKILERIKLKKVERKSRRDSIGSYSRESSSSLKRENSDKLEGDSSSQKSEV